MNRGRKIADLFSIRQEEKFTIFLLFGYSFFISIGLYIYYVAATTLFLNNFSNDMLPLAYIAGGLFVHLIGRGSLYVQNKVIFSRLSISMIILLVISIGSLLTIYYFNTSKWIVFFLFLLIRANLFVFSFTFWVASSKIFNLEQAKRLFGLIGTGEVTASIIANFLVSFLVSHKIVNVDGLLIIAVINIAISLFFYLFIIKRFNKILSFKKAGIPKNTSFKSKSTVNHNKKYQWYVYLLALLPVVCLYLIEFIFSIDSKQQYQSKEQLATFLGQFLFTCSIIEFLVKALLYRFVTKTFGLSSNLIFLPISLIIISACIIFFHTIGLKIFFLIMMSRFIITSIRRSFSDTSFQLLYQPLEANESIELQNQVESYLKPLGYIIAGLSLIGLINLKYTQSVNVYSLLLIYLIIWLIIAYFMRDEYKAKLTSFIFKKNISIKNNSNVATKKTINSTISASDKLIQFEELIKLTESKNSNDRIKASSLLSQSNRYWAYKSLIKLLLDNDTQVRIAAIKASAQSNKSEIWLHLINNLFIDDYKQEACKALVSIGEPIINQLSNYIDKNSRNEQEIITIIKVVQHIGGPQAIRFLRRKIDYPFEAVRDAIHEALQKLAYKANIREKTYLISEIDDKISFYLWTIAVEVDLIDAFSKPQDNLLESVRYERQLTLEKLLNLLCIYHGDARFITIKEIIESRNKQNRGYLIEILNIILLNELKERVLPLFEDIPFNEIIHKSSKRYPQERLSIQERLVDIANKNTPDLTVITKALAINRILLFPGQDSLQVFSAYSVSSSKIVSEIALFALFKMEHIRFLAYKENFKKQGDKVHLLLCDSIIKDNTLHTLGVSKIEALLTTQVLHGIKMSKLVDLAESLYDHTLNQNEHLNLGDVFSINKSFTGLILTKGQLEITTPVNQIVVLVAPNYYLYSWGIKQIQATEYSELYFMDLPESLRISVMMSKVTQPDLEVHSNAIEL